MCVCCVCVCVCVHYFSHLASDGKRGLCWRVGKGPREFPAVDAGVPSHRDSDDIEGGEQGERRAEKVL